MANAQAVLKSGNRTTGGPPVKTYLIVPDIHVPYHCPKAIKLITKIIKELNPDGLVQLGDAIDAFQISTYSKDPARRNTLKEDIDDFKLILNEWARHLKSGANIHILQGNHESRLSRYIASNCRDLHGLVPDWPTLLGIKERNAIGRHRWHWHPYMKWDSCRIGDVILHHGFYFNQHAPATALQKYKCSIIFGHTHRLGMVTDGTHYAAMLGHVSNESETAHNPSPTHWTQAVGVLYVETSGRTRIDILPLKSEKVILHGKVLSI
ncbi:MAG: metallophosphoesterase [bacterium]